MIDFYLDKIQLRNVRCYGDEMMEMDFPINNLTVFTGRVGAGKSTIFKAVSMALYGEDGGAKNEKLSIDDLVNEKNGKNLEIHLYFHSTKDNENEETKYEIHLFHKHSKYNNKLVFVKNGKDISLSSKTETYDLIERTLIPSGVYHNTYYFTQQCKNFFTSLSNSEQKDIFNSILDLSEYKGYYENAKKKLDDESYKLKVFENDLKNEEFSLASFRKMHEDGLQNLKNVKENDAKNLNRLNILVEDLKHEIDKIRSAMPENVDTKINAINMEIQKITIEHNNLRESTNSTIQRDKDTFVNITIPSLKHKYSKLNLEKSKNNSERINVIKLDLQKLRMDVDNCSREIKIQKDEEERNIRSDYDTKLGKLTDEIKKSEKDVNDFKFNVQEKLTKLKDISISTENTLKTQKSVLESKNSGLNIRVSNIKERMDDIQNKIKEYEYALDEPDAVCSLCGQKLNNKEHVQKHINDLKLQLKELNIQLSDINNKIIENDNGIKKLDADILKNKSDFVVKRDEIKNELTTFESSEKEKQEQCRKTYNDLINECSDIIKNIEKKYNELLNSRTLNYSQSIKNLDDELDSLDAKNKEIYNELVKEYNIEKYNLQKSNDDKCNELLSNLNNQQIIVDNKIKELRIQLIECNRIKSQIESDLMEIGSMEKSILQYEHEIETISSSTFHEELYASINGAQKMIEDTLVRINKCKDNVKQTKQNVDIFTFWKNAFSDSGIKSMLMDAAIPHMNECVGSELDRVAPGKFTVSFDTVSETKTGKIRDKFSVNILNNEKCSSGHKKLSGGEKRIIDLCCMSALRSLAEKLYGKKFHHIFYDEILDSLDDECKQAFCANVKYQSQNGSNITLITHDMPEDVEPDRTFPF